VIKFVFFMGLFDDNNSGETFVEAIRDGEIVRVSEGVALREDLFILRKVSANSNHQSKPEFRSVAPPAKKDEVGIRNPSLLNEWKIGKFGKQKNNVLADLRPDFRWEISRQRKIANMSRQKLAQLIGASEHEVKLLELGELPSDDFILISRVEQLFNISLRKYPVASSNVNLASLQKSLENKPKTASSNEKNSFSDSEIEILDD
jgi:ribosome-binding protein aMBF1 (putative translation factor)